MNSFPKYMSEHIFEQMLNFEKYTLIFLMVRSIFYIREHIL